jgi:hypothetical protein
MTNKFRFWAPKVLDLRPHKVYFFELCLKFYIKSSPKTLKLVYISRESEKVAKNSYGSYSTEFVHETQTDTDSTNTPPKTCTYLPLTDETAP